MIEVTTLHGKTFYLNPDLLFRMEETPDTMLIFVDSKTIVVKETPAIVIQRIIAYRQQLHQPILTENGNQ